MEIKNAHGGYLKKSSYEEFLSHDQYYRDAMAKNHGDEYASTYYKGKDDKRLAVLADFPYSVVVEGYYPEHDFCVRWCWQQFGPFQTEKCYEYCSEYPACPEVQATKTIRTGKNQDGSEWSEPEYSNPGDHAHQGDWTTIWLGKTGYDYGYNEFCFKLEAMRDAFAAVAETLGFGERYGNGEEGVSEKPEDGQSSSNV